MHSQSHKHSTAILDICFQIYVSSHSYIFICLFFSLIAPLSSFVSVPFLLKLNSLPLTCFLYSRELNYLTMKSSPLLHLNLHSVWTCSHFNLNVTLYLIIEWPSQLIHIIDRLLVIDSIDDDDDDDESTRLKWFHFTSQQIECVPPHLSDHFYVVIVLSLFLESTFSPSCSHETDEKLVPHRYLSIVLILAPINSWFRWIYCT